MCGRYTVAKDQETLSLHFGAEFSETHLPIFNASPGQHLPVILDVEPHKIQTVFWGITTDLQDQPCRMLINARSEAVNRRPTFRNAFRQRRCLILADGFYEWQATGSGKQPYRIVLNANEPFAFAGIWQEHQGEPTYVILTDGSEHRHETDPQSDAGNPGAGQTRPMARSGSACERCAQALDSVSRMRDAGLSCLNRRKQLEQSGPRTD